MLTKNVAIIIQSDLSENAILKGVVGSGIITIYMDSDYKLYGGLTLRNCSIQIELGQRINGNDRGVNIVGSG